MGTTNNAARAARRAFAAAADAELKAMSYARVEFRLRRLGYTETADWVRGRFLKVAKALGEIA